MAVRPDWDPTPEEAAAEIAAAEAALDGQRALVDVLFGDLARHVARARDHVAQLRAHCAERGIPVPEKES